MEGIFQVAGFARWECGWKCFLFAPQPQAARVSWIEKWQLKVFRQNYGQPHIVLLLPKGGKYAKKIKKKCIIQLEANRSKLVIIEVFLCRIIYSCPDYFYPSLRNIYVVYWEKCKLFLCGLKQDKNSLETGFVIVKGNVRRNSDILENNVFAWVRVE